MCLWMGERGGRFIILGEEILGLLFPPRCPVCDRILELEEIRKGNRIHATCRKKLYPVMQPFCCHCGRPVADGEVEYCFDCRKKIHQTESPYWKGKPASFFLRGRSVFLYRGEIRKTMYRFKYSNRREYASFLAQEAVSLLGDWIVGCGVEAVVPVPLYKGKQKRRGYNQAGLFAGKLAKMLRLSYEPAALVRMRDTTPQKVLDDKERKNNLKSAFQAADFVVKYKCILLVDDIYTTGSTAEAAAGELYAAGVKKIYFLAACIGEGF